MRLGEATQDERAIVASALADFRVYWASFPTLWRCVFAGTVADLHALDYLDYEGLRYPESGIAGAALVWGNVLVTSGPFRWYFDESLGGLALCATRADPMLQVIWPYGRVYEIQCAGWPPRCEKYQRLTAEAVLECLTLGGFDERHETRLRDLIRDTSHSEFLERIEAALERLRGTRA
jgi:hypothetical protein